MASRKKLCVALYPENEDKLQVIASSLGCKPSHAVNLLIAYAPVKGIEKRRIGKRILALRTRMGLTLDELAERVGVSTQTISYWERDEKIPRVDRLHRIAAALGTTLASLLEGEPEHAATK